MIYKTYVTEYVMDTHGSIVCISGEYATPKYKVGDIINREMSQIWSIESVVKDVKEYTRDHDTEDTSFGFNLDQNY